MSRRMRVLIDVPEPRPVKGRLAVGADGSTWDFRPGTTASNVWIDPCTSTVMLAPLPVTSAWTTTFTGNYARYQYSDFSGTDIAKWQGFRVSSNNNDTALRTKQATSQPINLTAPLDANTPVWFRYHRNQTQDSTDDIILVAGFNVGAGGAAPNNFSVQLKFRNNGSISVFKNGTLEAVYDRSGTNFSSARAYTSVFNPARKWINVMVIPFRGRELLVWTDNGTCFSHVFDGLGYPNNPATAPILPAGQLSFTVPTGTISIQAARVYFEQSGYIMGASKTLRYAPTAGEWTTPTTQVYSDQFGAGATMPTVTTTVVDATSPYATFVGNGTKTDVRIKVAWSGASGGTNTGVYCADAWVDQPASATYDGTIDITTAVQSLSLDVGEDGRTSLSMTARVRALSDLGVPKLTETGDRPIAIQLSSPKTGASWVDLFRGTLSPPELTYETGDDPYTYGTLAFTGVDRFGDFDVTMFPEAVPNDGNTIAQVYDRVLPVAGYSTATYLLSNYTSSFTVPLAADISRGSYTMVPKRGDYVGGYLNSFRDEYLATWYTGWRPTTATTPTGGYKFQISDPAVVGTTAALTLYQSYADAQAYGGYLLYESPQRTVRALKRYYESPEANQVTVVGQDPRTGRLLTKTTINTASQTPGTAPASRPDNWRGRPVQYIYTSENLTSQAAVNDAATLLYNRIGTGRYLIEWESDLLTYYTPSAIKTTMRAPCVVTITNGNATIAATGNDLPDGTRVVPTVTVGNILAGTTYYVRDRTTTTLSLAATAGGVAIVPTAGGTTTLNAPWLEGANTLSVGSYVTFERAVGGYATATQYYVAAVTSTLFEVTDVAGNPVLPPTASGQTYTFDGTQHTAIPWIGDSIDISLPESIPGTPPLLLGTYQIIAIPEIEFVQESTAEDTLHVRRCKYRGLYKF